MIEPLMIGLVVNLIYDVATRGKEEFEERTHLWQSVQDAAAESTKEASAISEDELYSIFAAELEDGQVPDLLSENREIIVRNLSERLEARDSAPDGTDHETLINGFLDEVEANLLSHTQPEEAFSVLLRYAQESRADHSNIQTQLESILTKFEPDLERLSRRSDRMFPERNQYTLRESDVAISREEQKEISDKLQKSSSVLVSGEAGVGKSGVVAQTAHQLRNDGKTVYFIDAREFSGITTLKDLEGDLGIENRIEAVLESIAENTTGCVLIIDQLDNVEGTTAGRVFQNLILDCTEISGIGVLCACRNWELNQEQYGRIRESGSIEEISVGNLRECKLKEILGEIGIREEDITEDIMDLGVNMLNLSLLSSIVSHSENELDVTKVKSEISLWRAYIDSLGRETTTERYSDEVSEADIINRAIHHSRSSLREARSTFNIERGNAADDRLRSRGVIDSGRGRQYRFHHDQLQTFFYAWDASSQNHFASDVLKDRIDDRVAADVFVWLAKLYADEDASRDSLLVGFLRDSLGKHSDLGYYAKAVLMDAISEMDPDQIGDSSFEILVRSLEDNYSLRSEFFRDCTNIDWAQKMIEFSVVQKLTGPGIKFIGRCSDNKPEIVAKSMETVENVSQEILVDYVEIIAKTSENQIGEEVAIMNEWLKEASTEDIGLIGRDLTSIFTQLVEDNQHNAAIELLGELFESEPPNPEPHDRYDDLENVPEQFQIENTSARPQIETNWLEEISPLISNLAEHEGELLVDTIKKKLSKALEYEADCYDDMEPAEVPNFSRVNQHSHRSGELKTILVDALLQAMEGWARSNNSSKVASQLEAFLSSGPVYRKLSLDVLSQYPHQFSEIIHKELLNRQNYQSVNVCREFFLVLESGYPVLGEVAKETVRAMIMDGPRTEFVESRIDLYEKDPHVDNPVESATASSEMWVRDRLWMIREEISQEANDKLESLIDEHGKPVGRLVTGQSASTEDWDVENDSSVLSQHLDSLSPSELVEYCVNDRNKLSLPEAVESEVEYLDDQRLARELQQRSREHPDEYIEHLPALLCCEKNVYLSQALAGIDTALTMSDDELINKWEPLVEVATTISDDVERYDEELLRPLSELFHHLVGYEGSYFPLAQYSDGVEKLLVSLLFWREKSTSVIDGEAMAEKIQGNRAAVASTIRTRALDGVMRYIRIQAPDTYTAESDGDLGELESLFEEVTEVFSDGDLDLRIMMGRHLYSIWYACPSSFDEYLEELLPEDDQLGKFMSVWYGYLAGPYILLPVFDSLKPKYKYAIDNLDTNLGKAIASSRNGGNLSQHIAGAFTENHLNGLNDPLNIGLLESTVAENENFSSSYTQYFHEAISNAGASDERFRIWTKSKEFWQWRIDHPEISEMVDKEVTNYIRCLEEITSVSIRDVNDLLQQSIEISVLDGYQNHVLERYLVSKVDGNQELVMEIYLSNLEERIEAGNVIYVSDECWEIISAAIENSKSREDALEAAEILFERGNPEYRELIDQHSQSER